METKICSRCKVGKDLSEFRMRYDKRGKGSKSLVYPNNTCRKCDTEIQNKYYFKHKDTPGFLEKWINKSREYYSANREKIKEKMKLKRQTPEYKAMMKAYREKNKEKIYKQELVTKQRYHKKNRDNITDTYAINILKNNKKEVNEESIEIQKNKILIHRIKDVINNNPIGKQKKCSVCGEIKDLSEFWNNSNSSDKKCAYCKSCGIVKNQKQKIKRQNEKHNIITQPPI